MISLRCSGLPLLFSCASSSDDDLLIDAAFEAADVGSAVHEAMRSVVLGLDPDLDAVALRWGCDRDEVGRLTWYARKAWAELAPSFPDPVTETTVSLRHKSVFELTGHVDLFARIGESEAALLDWKTGRVDGDYYAQLAGYATCLILGDGYKRVTATVVWCREQEAETYVFDAKAVEAWVLRLIGQLSRRGKYTVGAHCAHCPRSHSCAAVQAKVRESVVLFRSAEWSTDAVAATLDGLPPNERVALFRQAKLVAALAESAKAAVRLNVIQNGGELDAGDGKVLKIVEEPGKRVIDTEKAWPILEARLDDGSEIASVLDVSASRLDDLVAKKAGKGKGAGAKRDLRAELEAAGALTQGTTLKLTERRKDTTP